MSGGDKLEKALAIDVDAPVVFANKQYWRTSDHRKYVREGAAFESARLAKLHEALVAAVEALEEYSCECEEANHVTGLMKKMECYRCHVLSKIDKVLEEK